MNKTSTDKIKSATPFLVWFRRCLPLSLQAQVRPHLDRPCQLALNILDWCEEDYPLTLREIAQATGLSAPTVKQVLLALEAGGVPFVAKLDSCSSRGWQVAQAAVPQDTVPQDAETLATAPPTPFNVNLSSTASPSPVPSSFRRKIAY